MIKNRIILAFIIGTFIIVSISVVRHITSFRTLSIALSSEVDVVVTDKDSRQVGSLSDSGTLSLQDGIYSITPVGDKVDTTKTSVTIDGDDVSVTIAPDYSVAYLQTELDSQKDIIQKTMEDVYGSRLDSFLLNGGMLIKKGEWYITTLTKKVQFADMSSDVYRIILYRKDGTWSVVTPPSIVLNYDTYPTIPREVIDAANELVGDSGRAYTTFRVKENFSDTPNRD